jgi:alkaline phosphatase D
MRVNRRTLIGGAAATAALSGISGTALAAKTSEPALTRIAFGSCARQNKEQPIWDQVNAWNPELFIFLGDNIYGDTEDMDVLRGKYDMLAAKPGFQKLRAQSEVIATWDDHDYGVNDGGREYRMKRESREIFLDFWQVPANHPRRLQAEGIHAAYYYGPAGRRVQVIMPDNRTFRSPLKGYTVEPEDQGQYFTNSDRDATMLGAAQWDWLEAELRQPADLRIFASSTQVLADQPGYEAWVNFQADHQRLLDLIDYAQVDNIVMISGDTHYTELSRLSDGVPYPLYDLTCSGLTEVWPVFGPNKNRIAKGPLKPNFGRISIDWDGKGLLRENGGKAGVMLESEMLGGEIAIRQFVGFDELKQDNR